MRVMSRGNVLLLLILVLVVLFLLRIVRIRIVGILLIVRGPHGHLGS